MALIASRLRRLAVVQRMRPGAGPRAVAPPGFRAARSRTLTGRAGRFAVQLRRGRPIRGGFFKSLVKTVGKVVGTVTKLPVVGTVAKAALSSLPVVGQVMTAVNAVKGLTAASASAGIAGGVSALPAGGTGIPARTWGKSTAKPRRRKRGGFGRWVKGARKQDAHKREARAHRRKRKGGGTAKQRAARARFARAAKRGRIRKGTRLR